MKKTIASILFLAFFIPTISYGEFSNFTKKKESFWSRIGKSIESILTFGRTKKEEKLIPVNQQNDLGTFDNSKPSGLNTLQVNPLNTLSVPKTKPIAPKPKPKPKTVEVQEVPIQEPTVYSNPPVQSNLPSQQAMETALTKMLRQQCYDTYPARTQIQANIDKISSNQEQKTKERQELIAKIEREISAMENSNDSLTNSRKMFGTQDKFIADMREIKYQAVGGFDATWDTLHSVIGSTNLSQSREEMCNF